MLALSISLWAQAVILVILGGATFFAAAQAPKDAGKIATFSGIVFGSLTAVSIWGALTVGGMA